MPSAFDGYLPDGWEEREAEREKERRAAALGLTVQEHEDLKVWLIHGRIGIGRSYQEEVERAKKIEAARRTPASVPSTDRAKP